MSRSLRSGPSSSVGVGLSNTTWVTSRSQICARRSTTQPDLRKFRFGDVGSGAKRPRVAGDVRQRPLGERGYCVAFVEPHVLIELLGQHTLEVVAAQLGVGLVDDS